MRESAGRLTSGALLAAVSLYLMFGALAGARKAQAEPGARVAGVDSYYSVRVSVDRSAVPPEVFFEELTLLIETGDAEAVAVSTGDVPMESHHDVAAGMVAVTTVADTIDLLLTNPQDVNAAGSVKKAELKYDRQWAWSHSLDDNTNLRASVAALDQRGWAGTLYIVGNYLAYAGDGGNEDMLTAAEVQHYLEQGWSVGNHSWNHECDANETLMHQTVISNYERLRTLVSNSARSDYKVTAFAAPCMRDAYTPVVRDIIEADLTNLLFNETHINPPDGQYYNFYRIIVDPNATDDPSWNTAVFSPAMPIGRDFTIDGNKWDTRDGNPAATISTIDSLVAETGPERHMWYNSASHGYEEAALATVADHVQANYGPGSAKPVWMAPADQIYGYLLVRDKSVVSVTGPQEVVPAGFAQSSVTRAGEDLVLTFDTGAEPAWYRLDRDSSPYFMPTATTQLTVGHGATLVYTDTGVLAETQAAYYRSRMFVPPGSVAEPAEMFGSFSFAIEPHLRRPISVHSVNGRRGLNG